MWKNRPIKSLRKSRFIENDKFKIECEICLYANNKIGIISYKDGFGVLINSQSIFNTMKSIFEVMWDGGIKVYPNVKTINLLI